MKILHSCDCHFNDKDENCDEVDLNWEWIRQTSDKWTGLRLKCDGNLVVNWYSVNEDGDEFYLNLGPLINDHVLTIQNTYLNIYLMRW